MRKNVAFAGSSNSAENIKYDDTKNVKEAIDELNSNLNVRYNQQTDKLQLLIDGVWVDWKTAGINEYNVLAKNQNINIGNSDTMWSVVGGNKGNPVNYTLNTKTVGQSGAILIGSTSANAQIHIQSPVVDCSSYDKAIISASMVSTGNGFIYYYANGGAMQFIKMASATGESLSVTDYELDITDFDTIQIGVGSGTTVMNFNYSITKFILTN